MRCAIRRLLAAVLTVGLYFLPPTFWMTTVDLVTFEREGQGIPNAVSLWDIGILGQFGVGDGGTFARAIGPFTHPVGTAHYFVLPLVIASCAAMRAWQLGPPGGQPVLGGTDVIEVVDGRIARLWTMLDR